MLGKIETILVGVIVFLNIYFAVRVFLNDEKNLRNRVFSIYTIFMSLWILTAYLSEFFPISSPSLCILFSKASLSSSLFFIHYLLMFSLTYNKRISSDMTRKIGSVLLLFTICFAILTIFSNKIIEGIVPLDYSFNIVYSDFYRAFYLPYTLALAAFSFYNFLSSYKKSDIEEKKQLKFFFSGVLVVFALGITFGLIIPQISGIEAYYRIGNYSTIILTIFTAYAILRTKFMSRQLIISEFFIVLILTGLIVDTIISDTIAEIVLKSFILLGMVFLADLLLRAIFEDRKKSAIIGELNKNLESANSKLKALDAMKTEFVSLASHELLTPVSAIEGYLSMILDEKMVKITDKKALEYLGNVSKSSHRLARLITDLLNVSRIEEGRMMVERSRANISEIIKQVVSEIEVKAKKSNIKIKFQKKDDGCCEIYADIDKVKEVLVNLCSNAIKYNKPEGVVEISFQTMTVEQIVSLGGHSGRQDLEIEKEDGAIVNAVSDVSRQLVGEKQLVISVKDSGIGIKKDEVKNLFKKFSRIGDWSVQEVQGTGLGLYISKALTEMNRGRMWVDSEGEGKGSTFHFSIPLLIDKDKVIEIDEQVPKIKNAKPLAKGSIDE